MRNYPVVPVKEVVDDYFGHAVVDPYRYLEDAKSPQTLEVVRAENEYTHAFFERQTSFSAAELEKKLRAKPVDEELSDVQQAGGVICAARKLEGGIHDIVRLDSEMNVVEVIVNEEMLGGRMHVYRAEPCPAQPGIYAVMGVIHGHPRCCVVIWDANEKKAIAELDGTFGFAWSTEGKYVYYSEAQLDAVNNRNINIVRRYNWRENRLEDLYTHEENAVFIDVTPGPEDGYFFMVLNSYSDILVLWCGKDGSITHLNDGAGSYAYIGCSGERCYFKTNVGAPMCRVISISFAQLKEKGSLLNACSVAIPESDALLSAAGVVPGGILTVHERDACSEMSLYGFDSRKVREVALPDRFGCAKFSDVIRVSDSGNIYFNYESFTRRLSLYAMNAKSLEIHCLRSDAADVSDIAVDQCFLKARDGERILVYIVRPKDLAPNGETPVLMYGYGGYACSMPPWPEDMVTGHNIVEWVRKGRIYAHCILRGGMEYGEEWHRAAMFDRKKNAFYDFIDIAEYLIASGWTRPGKIVATGLSNGGLLMTAITTLRPDLFGVVVASVPHTDMLRFRNDDRGMMYITEYGDPLSSREMFEYMYSYSPYHNIHAGTVYPWIYVQTGEMDNNVPPYHGKKFAVRLQKEADEKNPVLLQVLATGSHDRGVGDEYYKNIAQMQTFVELGLEAQK